MAKCPDGVQAGEGKQKYRKEELKQQQKVKRHKDNVDWNKYLRRCEKDKSEEEDSEEPQITKEHEGIKLAEDNVYVFLYSCASNKFFFGCGDSDYP